MQGQDPGGKPLVQRVPPPVVAELVAQDVLQRLRIGDPVGQNDPRGEDPEHQGCLQCGTDGKRRLSPGDAGIESLQLRLRAAQRRPEGAAKAQVGDHRPEKAEPSPQAPEGEPEQGRAPVDPEAMFDCGGGGEAWRGGWMDLRLRDCRNLSRQISKRRIGRGCRRFRREIHLFQQPRRGQVRWRAALRLLPQRDQPRQGQQKAQQHQQPGIVIHRAGKAPAQQFFQKQQQQRQGAAGERQREQSLHPVSPPHGTASAVPPDPGGSDPPSGPAPPPGPWRCRDTGGGSSPGLPRCCIPAP